MRATYGNRQGVGGIIGRRLFFQTKQSLRHIGHLLLGGLAVSDHGLLYLQRRKFDQWGPVHFDGQQYYAARLAYRHRRRYIAAEEQFLHANHIRLSFTNQCTQFFI